MISSEENVWKSSESYLRFIQNFPDLESSYNLRSLSLLSMRYIWQYCLYLVSKDIRISFKFSLILFVVWDLFLAMSKQTNNWRNGVLIIPFYYLFTTVRSFLSISLKTIPKEDESFSLLQKRHLVLMLKKHLSLRKGNSRQTIVENDLLNLLQENFTCPFDTSDEIFVNDCLRREKHKICKFIS